MLNESFRLAQALKKNRISFSETHPNLRNVTESGLRVKFQEDGTLDEVLLYDVKNEFLWKYAPDNQFSFPTGKLSGPLLQVDEKTICQLQEAQKDPDRQSEILAKFAEDGAITENGKVRDKFWRGWCKDTVRLAGEDKARKGILQFLRPGEPLELAIRNRETLGEFTPEVVQAEIQKFVLALSQASACGTVPLEITMNLLVGKWDEKKKEYVSKETAILLDFAASLQTKEVRARMSEVLFQSERQNEKESQDTDTICALTGTHGALVDGRFIQVNLPVFAQKTSLLAMNPDVHCQKRYGQTAAEICPIGKNTEKEIANALLWITHEERKGKTWCPVGQEQKQKKGDLLMVYCEELPDNGVKVAETMGGDDCDYDEEPDSEEPRFIEETKKVCDLLKVEVPDCPNPRLVCLILREVDKARRQVLYEDSFTSNDLERAALLWKEGAENVPGMIRLMYPDKKGTKAYLHRVSAPFLMAVLKLYKAQWKSDLSGTLDVHGISYPDVLEVFLDRGNRTRFSLNEMLEKLLQCTEPVLRQLGQIIHQDWKSLNDWGIPEKKTAIQTMATIGILLHKLGYKKEVYMNETAYQLGRLLSLLDRLHVFYCNTVRNGDIPGQLLGNSFLSVVSDNPAAGIGRLMDRVKIYKAWADKFANEKPGKNETPQTHPRGLVGWCLREIGRATQQIHDLEMSEKRMTAIEKSCLLLGYLAATDKNDTPEKTDGNEQNAEE